MTIPAYLKGFGYTETSNIVLVDRQFTLQSIEMGVGGKLATLEYAGIISTATYLLFLTEKSFNQSTIDNIILNANSNLDGYATVEIEDNIDEKGHQIQIKFIQER